MGRKLVYKFFYPHPYFFSLSSLVGLSLPLFGLRHIYTLSTGRLCHRAATMPVHKRSLPESKASGGGSGRRRHHHLHHHGKQPLVDREETSEEEQEEEEEEDGVEEEGGGGGGGGEGDHRKKDIKHEEEVEGGTDGGDDADGEAGGEEGEGQGRALLFAPSLCPPSLRHISFCVCFMSVCRPVVSRG